MKRQAGVALIGPRQVGKTTLAHAIAEQTDALYLDLEAGADRAKLADPALFLAEYEDRLVVLDEIHRAPELFQELRGLIDRGRRLGKGTGRFLILGSASVDLLRQSGESLAGRIEYVPLNPLDVLDVTAATAPMAALWGAAGFPTACSRPAIPTASPSAAISFAPICSATFPSSRCGGYRPRRWSDCGRCWPTARAPS